MRDSGSKICRHEGDRPAVPAQRRPCPPNTAGRLSGTRHYRSDYRRSTAPLPDGQALASRHSLRVGRSTRRVRIWFSLRSPTLTATFHRSASIATLQNETPKLAGRDRRLFRRPCAPFSDTETAPGVEKAAYSPGFPATAKNHTKTKTGWLRRQSDANLSLPANLEIQGDFHEMQGGAKSSPA